MFLWQHGDDGGSGDEDTDDEGVQYLLVMDLLRFPCGKTQHLLHGVASVQLQEEHDGVEIKKGYCDESNDTRATAPSLSSSMLFQQRHHYGKKSDYIVVVDGDVGDGDGLVKQSVVVLEQQATMVLVLL
mmetsp:Transcript_11907/g.18404  ORF Transcript_11907/g.18404 Transcript_11907/m.18404 type:complete len:129 (-) Transcript_11907:623-1009(-)